MPIRASSFDLTSFDVPSFNFVGGPAEPPVLKSVSDTVSVREGTGANTFLSNLNPVLGDAVFVRVVETTQIFITFQVFDTIFLVKHPEGWVKEGTVVGNWTPEEEP